MSNTVYCKLKVIAGLSHDKVMGWLGEGEVEYNKEEKSYSWTSVGAPDITSVVQLHAVYDALFTFTYEDVLGNVQLKLSFEESPSHLEIYPDKNAIDADEVCYPLYGGIDGYHYKKSR
jgi:hypothetical protein